MGGLLFWNTSGQIGMVGPQAVSKYSVIQKVGRQSVRKGPSVSESAVTEMVRLSVNVLFPWPEVSKIAGVHLLKVEQRHCQLSEKSYCFLIHNQRLEKHLLLFFVEFDYHQRDKPVNITSQVYTPWMSSQLM